MSSVDLGERTDQPPVGLLPGRRVRLSPWLLRRGGRLRLTAAARERLSLLFASTGKDLGTIRVRTGFTGTAAAFALGRTVVIDAGRWNAMSPEQQLGLLAHEITHCAQYAAIGGLLAIPRFLKRYLPEYSLDKHNYQLPEALANQPLRAVRLLDERYTLDQIAQRFRREIDPESVKLI